MLRNAVTTVVHLYVCCLCVCAGKGVVLLSAGVGRRGVKGVGVSVFSRCFCFPYVLLDPFSFPVDC